MGYLREKVFPYHLSLLPSLTRYKALGCHVSKFNDCDIRPAKPLMVTNILSGDHSIISGPQKATLNKASLGAYYSIKRCHAWKFDCILLLASGGSTLWDKGKRKGAGGGVQSPKKNFQPFGSQFGLKIRGWGQATVAPPLDPPLLFSVL